MSSPQIPFDHALFGIKISLSWIINAIFEDSVPCLVSKPTFFGTKKRLQVLNLLLEASMMQYTRPHFLKLKRRSPSGQTGEIPKPGMMGVYTRVFFAQKFKKWIKLKMD